MMIDCLEDKVEDYWNCSVLYCASQCMCMGHSNKVFLSQAILSISSRNFLSYAAERQINQGKNITSLEEVIDC